MGNAHCTIEYTNTIYIYTYKHTSTQTIKVAVYHRTRETVAIDREASLENFFCKIHA